MRVPRDQGLFLTVFLSCCVTATLVLWVSLPLHFIPQNDEEDGGETVEQFSLPEAVSPKNRVIRMEKALAMAQTVIDKLDAEGKDEEKGKAKGKDAGKPGGKAAAGKAAPPTAAKAPEKETGK